MDPFLSAHFSLQIAGLASAGFSECAGLSSEIGTEEVVEGGENRFSYQLPTRASFPNLVLKRGMADTRELWDWFFELRTTGRVAPRDGQILLMGNIDGEMAPARAWSFSQGWPVKMIGPDLNAQLSAVAIETIEITHRGLTLMEV